MHCLNVPITQSPCGNLPLVDLLCEVEGFESGKDVSWMKAWGLQCSWGSAPAYTEPKLQWRVRISPEALRQVTSVGMKLLSCESLDRRCNKLYGYTTVL